MINALSILSTVTYTLSGSGATPAQSGGNVAQSVAGVKGFVLKGAPPYAAANPLNPFDLDHSFDPFNLFNPFNASTPPLDKTKVWRLISNPGILSYAHI
jgi:hypothetical protein